MIKEDLKMIKEASPYKPTLTYRVLEIMVLLLTTVVLIAMIVVSALASFPDLGGFQNSTGVISDSYTTQITPASWTFLVWNIIFITQALWVIYGWSFVFRPSTPRSISLVTYVHIL